MLTLKSGERVLVCWERDFEDVILDKLGWDALDYFRQAVADRIDAEEFSSDPFKYCPFQGECDWVYQTQGHCDNFLRDVRDELASWATRKWTKAEIEEKRDALYERICHEIL
jgi:hypothetical protein